MVELTKIYNEEEYPKYDNFDAIEVSKVKDIPMGYHGLIGVPITFVGKYDPIQFEIVGKTGIDGIPHQLYVNGKRKYQRIIIRHNLEYSVKVGNKLYLL